MIFSTTVKTKCDVKDCKNDAKYFFPAKTRNGKFFLCNDCLNGICADGRSLCVPKSPQNAIKRQIDKKSEEQNYVKD